MTVHRLYSKGQRLLYAGNLQVRHDPRLSLEPGTGSLMISRLEDADAGSYQCEVETEEDTSVSLLHRVELLREPRLLGTNNPTGHLRELKLQQGSNASIACRADGNPDPTVFWTKVGTERVINEGPELIIDGVEKNDAGRYVCTAFNGVGYNASAHFFVSITCKCILLQSVNESY